MIVTEIKQSGELSWLYKVYIDRVHTLSDYTD